MSGLKFDQGKDRWELLPLKLVQHIVKVFTFGATKYGDNNWQGLDNGYDRCKAALFRHLSKHESGEIYDEESGLPHLAHAAWNALVLIHFGYEQGKKGGNKDYDKVEGQNILQRLSHLRAWGRKTY